MSSRRRRPSDIFLRFEVIKKALGLLALLVNWIFGMHGLLWGQVTVKIAALAVITYFTGKLVDDGFVN